LGHRSGDCIENKTPRGMLSNIASARIFRIEGGRYTKKKKKMELQTKVKQFFYGLS